MDYGVNRSAETKIVHSDVETVGLSVERQQNVEFADATEQPAEQVPIPSFAQHMKRDDAGGIADFLKKPVLLGTETLNGSSEFGSFTATQDPLRAFLISTTIASRIKYFKLLAFDAMRFKVVVTSNKYIYGLGTVCYHPNRDSANVAIGENVVGIFRSYAWTLPHIVFSPGDDVAGEFVVPYHAPGEAINLECVTHQQTWMVNGALFYRIFAPLRSANAAVPVSVKLSVYMWLENPRLVGLNPYANVLSEADYVKAGVEKVKGKMAGHAKKVTDKIAEATGVKGEYGKGPISNVASTVALASQKLATIPFIAPYASALSGVAEGVSQFASFFGFSKPPVIDDAKRVVPSMTSQLSTYNGEAIVDKLAFDIKNETTIDPRLIMGSSEDELDFSVFFRRESYLGAVTWADSAADGAFLASIPVTPAITVANPSLAKGFAETGGTGTTRPCEFWEVKPTFLGYGSQLFEFWTGSIEYRIVIPASTFHRGRLRIAYFPSNNTSNPTGDISNAAYVAVLDVSGPVDFRFTVPWMQAMNWLARGSNHLVLEDFSSAGLIVPNVDSYNGHFTISVLNALSEPADASPVTILVFIRAGEDFRVARPSFRDIQRNRMCMPENNIAGYTTTFVSNCLVEADTNFIPYETGVNDNRELIHFGEAIRSFRTVMKRQAPFFMIATPNVANAGVPKFRTFVWPMYMVDYPSYYNTELTDDRTRFATLPLAKTTNSQATFCNTPFNHLRMCFLGVRGGMRYFVRPLASAISTATNTVQPTDFWVYLSAPPPVYGRYMEGADSIKPISKSLTCFDSDFFGDDDGDPTPEFDHMNVAMHFMNTGYGFSTGSRLLNPSSYVEVPYYSPYAFLQANSHSCETDFTAGDTSSANTYTVAVPRVACTFAMSTASTMHFGVYQSTAEDLTLAGLLYPPAHYYQLQTGDRSDVNWRTGGGFAFGQLSN